MKLKRIINRIHWLLSAQFGINIKIAIRSIFGIPRYLRDLRLYRSVYKGSLKLMPCLYDWHEEGGIATTEYFWQDLLVAKMIYAADPERHVDVGSRIDGFVAHVASFREIEVFDIRPITTQIPNVVFKKNDIMQPLINNNYCDSLSCLHALEHFGLGRYGDPINPDGFKHGLSSMAGLLKRKGILYLSIPIGKNRVEFNAHRVFDPRIIINFCKSIGLNLKKIILISPRGEVTTNIILDEAMLTSLSEMYYVLGLFIFHKN